jgi:hypothetical protein
MFTGDFLLSCVIDSSISGLFKKTGGGINVPSELDLNFQNLASYLIIK